MYGPTGYGYQSGPPGSRHPPAAGVVVARIGGGVGLAGAMLVWLSLLLPWWDLMFFGSLTLWQLMGLDEGYFVVAGMAVLALLGSGLLGLAGGVVGIVLQARTGLILAGVGGLASGLLVGVVSLYFLAVLFGDSSGVGPGGGLIAAGLGCPLLLSSGVLVLVGGVIMPDPGLPRGQLRYAPPAPYRPPVA